MIPCYSHKETLSLSGVPQAQHQLEGKVNRETPAILCHSPENGNRYGNDVWEQTDIAIAISVCSGDIYKNKYLLLRESINIDSQSGRE